MEGLVGSSVPPLVHGEIQGDLLIEINSVLPLPPHTLPSECHVRFLWWGEPRPGSLFRPSNLHLSNSCGNNNTNSTIMIYPITVDEEALDIYFQDMVKYYINMMQNIM